MIKEVCDFMEGTYNNQTGWSDLAFLITALRQKDKIIPLSRNLISIPSDDLFFSQKLFYIFLHEYFTLLLLLLVFLGLFT